jgi:hypothetical protein
VALQSGSIQRFCGVNLRLTKTMFNTQVPKVGWQASTSLWRSPKVRRDFSAPLERTCAPGGVQCDLMCDASTYWHLNEARVSLPGLFVVWAPARKMVPFTQSGRC